MKAARLHPDANSLSIEDVPDPPLRPGSAIVRIEALPAQNTDRYFREWEALFLRADLTPKEVRLLEHMARKMARGQEE